jgi:hypothetical protein
MIGERTVALVPPGMDQHIKNFALGIHGTPEIDQTTVDLEIDLVEMPDGMWLRPARQGDTKQNLPAGTRFGATYRLLPGWLGAFAHPPLGRTSGRGLRPELGWAFVSGDCVAATD